VNKNRIITELFKFSEVKVSTDRLRRIAQMPKYGHGNISRSGIIDDDTAAVVGPVLAINDPAATIVCCERMPFLAIVQVVSIKFSGQSIDSVPLDRLHDEGISVICQILDLKAQTPSDENKNNDWVWRSHLGESFSTPGRLLSIINPPISTTDAHAAHYIFRSDELQTVAASIYAGLKPSDLSRMPTVKTTTWFPYRTKETNKAAFLCESDSDEREMLPSGQKHFCPYCPNNVPLDFTNGPAILSHFAMHKLFDPKVTQDEDTEHCGFCLRPTVLCFFFLHKVRGQKGTIQIDDKKTAGCINYGPFGVKRINYTIASQSTPSSPCSNVPLRCPCCPEHAPCVWKYNLKKHLQRHDVDPEQYSALWEISKTEKTSLKALWDKRNTRTRHVVEEEPPFKISEAHSSRLAISAT
ncbi:hypothetical protein SISNIDRAFT_420695, partial [Sistotremastrum niveocremeum HHB9708]